MSFNINRFYYDWKLVENGRFKKTHQICDRCNNSTQYQMVYDGDGYGFPGIWVYIFSKQYAYKCPICPNYEFIDKELAKAIIKK